MASKRSDEQLKYLKQYNNGIVKLIAYGLKYRTKEFMAVIIMILLTFIIVLKKEDLKQLPFVKKIFAGDKKK